MKTFFPERWAQNHFSTKPCGGAFKEGGTFHPVESGTPEGKALLLAASPSGKFQPTMPRGWGGGKGGGHRLSQPLPRECLLFWYFFCLFPRECALCYPLLWPANHVSRRSVVLEVWEIPVLPGISTGLEGRLGTAILSQGRPYCLRQIP